jgi:mono/diheme cytochrome c family protein
MKTILKALGALLLLGLIAIGGLLAFLSAKSPAQRPPSDEKVAATSERLARGRYLVENVSDCLGCHSDHEFDKFAIPIKPGSEGQGGLVFDKTLGGVPGVVVARNLTADAETGKGRWTDGELLRAIREGVDRDGAALFPMMPYEYFRSMSDEDARAVVAYLRTLKPVRHEIPARRLDFPVNLLVKLRPRPVEGPVATPDDAKDHLAYGEYLVKIAGCRVCHTAQDRGQEVGEPYAGGWSFKGPWGTVVSSNITPHPGTYLGLASKEEFIGRFKSFAGPPQPAPKGRNTVMPWNAYAGMTERDLGAIYDYLKTVKAVDKRVEPFPGG